MQLIKKKHKYFNLVLFFVTAGQILQEKKPFSFLYSETGKVVYKRKGGFESSDC